MKCPKCGCDNPDGSKYCMSCGYELIPDDAIICPQCGKVLPKDSQFCDNCGCKIEKSSNTDKPVSNKGEIENQFATENKPSNSKFLIIGIIAAVLIVGIVLFAILGNGSKKQEPTANDTEQEEVQTEEDDGDSTENSEPSVAEAKGTDLKVVDSGYSLIKPDEYADEPSFFYGLEYKNDSSKQAIGWIDVKVTCRDKDGGVIDTYEGSSLTCLEAGEIGCFAQSCGTISEKPGDVQIDFEFTPAEVDGYPDPNTIDKVEVTGTKIKKDDTFSEFVGDVENDSKKGLTTARVYVLFRNDKDEIVGGDEVYVDGLKAGKNAFSYDLLYTNLVTDNHTCYGVGESD